VKPISEVKCEHELNEFVKFIYSSAHYTKTFFQNVDTLMCMAMYRTRDKDWLPDLDAGKALELLEPLYKNEYFSRALYELDKYFQDRLNRQYPELSVSLTNLIEHIRPETKSMGGRIINGVGVRNLDESIRILEAWAPNQMTRIPDEKEIEKCIQKIPQLCDEVRSSPGFTRFKIDILLKKVNVEDCLKSWKNLKRTKGKTENKKNKKCVCC
jgi:hypothetical protein